MGQLFPIHGKWSIGDSQQAKMITTQDYLALLDIPARLYNLSVDSLQAPCLCFEIEVASY